MTSENGNDAPLSPERQGLRDQLSEVLALEGRSVNEGAFPL